MIVFSEKADDVIHLSSTTIIKYQQNVAAHYLGTSCLVKFSDDTSSSAKVLILLLHCVSI